ncbi:T9SS type A sorting domain-containing protein [Flavobacterium terrigena]|uniref:Por secretion system C-terminal sorting domain-containing protein n=1 Tax=Flavobacterium terrigena TaxID=402734 RepID=A0A1H6QM10_9FLAO|nr:T9SS type A sorting domain-containing protein [Flavobacterium terrigena]SEI44669.1 Por secretion system C-terminal sorting domain-containing protein [Flavobacterium terrigena]
MKQICLLFVSFFSSAQIVNIPDTYFKAKLLQADVTNNFASIEELIYNEETNSINTITNYCKIDLNNDGEIQVSEASNIKYLNFSLAYSITNPQGIEYFTNLIYLNISTYNSNIPNLNLSQNLNLKYLFCTNNNLITLNLGSNINLQQVDCSNNDITNIDLTQNTGLKKIICNNNQITSLNLLQNNSLNYINCKNNQITNLILPASSNQITYLDCSINQIPTLDLSQCSNLSTLTCLSNQLNSLDLTQNINLTSLNCAINSLPELDLANNVLLTNINCGNNLISNLILNSNSALTQLFCSNNLLTSLDISNNTFLIQLSCGNNLLTSLYVKNGKNESISLIPNLNLQYICCDEGQLANIQSIINLNGYTNCHVNTYCTFTPGGQFFTIQGQQKFDNENDNCDTTDNFIPNFKYSITNGTTTGSLISNNTGSYLIPVQTGTHTITPVSENPSYFTVSPTSATISFPTQASPLTQDFCITPNGTHHDVEVSIIPASVARPGFDSFYKIIYKNKGNQIENGTINLQFDDAILDLVSTNPTFTTQTLNNLSWTYSNLLPFETRTIHFMMNVNSPTETPSVNSGDILNYIATNTITNTDEMLSDNTFVLNQAVVNSYDPNDKTCLQGTTIPPSEVGKYVHYMIRFENTGTFPAENIVVKDMIDTAKFDVSSLIPLHASHNYVTRISGNKVEFIFENINLPFDDTTNDGYVAFKIKTKPTLVLGNTFSNTANIYFDYNFPIVTNTATTTIAALSNPSFEFANYFSLYPNPATNELNINLKSAIEINSIQIYNTIGQLVTIQTGNALKVDVSHLKTGNYFIKINTNEGYSTSQFIKE